LTINRISVAGWESAGNVLTQYRTGGIVYRAELPRDGTDRGRLTLSVFTENLAEILAMRLKRNKEIRFKNQLPVALLIWTTFALCLACSVIGVILSFVAFGSAITGFKLWGIGLVISVIMLGISYGAKYASEQARREFTPVDLVQYLGQGFLWPSTWPALADRLGVDKIEPPDTAATVGDLVRLLGRLAGMSY
jgi:hypothetical protein